MTWPRVWLRAAWCFSTCGPEPSTRRGTCPKPSRRPSTSFRPSWTASPGDVEVVAYCRGPYCVYADDAVRLLRARGRSARRLDVGFPEWRRAGHPVAVSDMTRARSSW